MANGEYQLRPIGWVRSPLVNLAGAPRQGDEGAPEAKLVFVAELVDGLKDLHAGEEVSTANLLSSRVAIGGPRWWP